MCIFRVTICTGELKTIPSKKLANLGLIHLQINVYYNHGTLELYCGLWAFWNKRDLSVCFTICLL